MKNIEKEKCMEYNVNIRQEVFGATIMNLRTGKREYVTNEELEKILNYKIFPSNSIINVINEEKNIKYTALKNRNINHFSFADIAYIELTRDCNLKCKHCLNNSGQVMPNQFNNNELIKLINELADEGLQEIRFTGGEPLVYKDIYGLINLATTLGLYTSIGTNATLITKDVAKKLKKAGLKKAIVSLDGTEEAHELIRGKGTYTKTIEGINNLKSNNIDVRINSVVMKDNMEDIINLAKKMHKNKTSLFIRRFIESGRGSFLKNNTLTKKDYDYLRNKLSYELENGNYINGHYLRNYEGIVHRINLPFKFTKGCKAGQRALVIMPDGELHLCGFLAAQGFESLGNVRNINDWNEYWNKIHQIDYLKILRNNLENYNSLPNIQPTNCLAYVQRFLNCED